LMYIVAALCMWVLRTWKIGQLEQVVAEQEKSANNTDAVVVEPSTDLSPNSTSRTKAKSSIVKRLLAWKRV